MKKNVAITALLFGAVAAGGLFYLTHAMAFKVAAAVPPAPVPVVAGVVAQHDVPIYQNGVGTVIAYNTDVVRAQIQGQLISINFTEGQTVHAGDLLAQIDPRPYQAQIDQFEGNLERDQAQLTNARANFTRYSQLGEKGWATPQLIETQKAQVGQLEAAIKTDQALIEAAKVQLSYTRLTSPIDGVVGIRQIDVGNIISPTTTNGLVVVTQLDPISLIFTLPEGVLPQIQKQPLKLDNIMVCWDGSRPAARAIGDAIPLLERAKAIEIVVVTGERDKSGEITGANMRRHLARHGITVEIKHITRGGAGVQNAILAHAADTGADFMVLGGYGHSRLREFILGGVTRSILKSMTVPVLMSH